jgi:hypothetical protein
MRTRFCVVRGKESSQVGRVEGPNEVRLRLRGATRRQVGAGLDLGGRNIGSFWITLPCGRNWFLLEWTFHE